MADGSPARRLILVVEDDAAIRDTLVEILRDEGYDVDTATNGVEAQERLALRRPSLVLLDLMMPVMDGWQLIRWMRAERAYRDIPICILSAANVTAMAGVASVLRKPVDLARLLDSIETHALG